MAIETSTPLTPSGSLLSDRYWSHVAIDPSGCWLWTAGLTKDGYARFGWPRSQAVHRMAYIALVGPIPEGFQVDHLCHDPNLCKLGDGCPHRHCVNPAHLEAVTPRENALRSGCPAAANPAKTHCPQGHPYDDVNTMWCGRKRRCRICRRLQVLASQHRRLARIRATA